MAALKDIVHADAKPIIVTDAGYKTVWFRQVGDLGWDFAGRVRKLMMYINRKQEWEYTITGLYKDATQRPKCFASQICHNKPLACHLVIYKARNKGRHSLTQHNVRRQSKSSKVYAKGANDPWLNATSLPRTTCLAKKIVNIYRKKNLGI